MTHSAQGSDGEASEYKGIKMTRAHTRSCELQDCTAAREARAVHAVYKDRVAESVG